MTDSIGETGTAPQAESQTAAPQTGPTIAGTSDIVPAEDGVVELGAKGEEPVKYERFVEKVRQYNALKQQAAAERAQWEQEKAATNERAERLAAFIQSQHPEMFGSNAPQQEEYVDPMEKRLAELEGYATEQRNAALQAQIRGTVEGAVREHPHADQLYLLSAMEQNPNVDVRAFAKRNHEERVRKALEIAKESGWTPPAQARSAPGQPGQPAMIPPGTPTGTTQGSPRSFTEAKARFLEVAAERGLT